VNASQNQPKIPDRVVALVAVFMMHYIPRRDFSMLLCPVVDVYILIFAEVAIIPLNVAVRSRDFVFV
jgi:hypothetical protein